MNKTKKICYLAVLTALYVVLSAFLKFNIIGNIQPDFGYLAFAVALCMFGVWGTVVGVIGCSLESILFSAYGFSISWAVANLIIGLICGIPLKNTKSILWKIVIIVWACILGVLIAKTVIECYLYAIPIEIKIPKNATAAAIDAAVMICGLLLSNRIIKAKDNG